MKLDVNLQVCKYYLNRSARKEYKRALIELRNMEDRGAEEVLSIDDIEGKELICIKGFSVDRVDGDGFTVEEGAIVVEEGSKWECEGPGYICSEVRLEGEECWLEVDVKTINECFKVI